MTPGTLAICRHCGAEIRWVSAWTGRWGWGHVVAARRPKHRAEPRKAAA
jgi:hypothetical protein